MDQEDLFDAAATYVAATTAQEGASPSLSSDTLLELYGLYKQATIGECTIKKPSIFDFRGRSKYDAWFRLGNLSKAEAQARYVDVLTSKAPDWSASSLKESKAVGGGAGPVFSTMTEDPIPDTQGSDYPAIIRATQEGQAALVDEILQNNSKAVHDTDEEGCTALHWAADKGNRDIVEMLIRSGAHTGAKDVDGLTPYNYAELSDNTFLTDLLV